MPETLYRKCPNCRGRGRVGNMEEGPNAYSTHVCDDCSGNGYVPVAPVTAEIVQFLFERRPCAADGCVNGVWRDGIQCSVCDGCGYVDWNLGQLPTGSSIVDAETTRAIEMLTVYAESYGVRFSHWSHEFDEVRAWLDRVSATGGIGNG